MAEENTKKEIKVSDFSQYQQKSMNSVAYFAISRQFVQKNETDSYSLKRSSAFAQLTFILTGANTLVKVVYILYLLYTQFGELEFLDKISAMLYLLVFGIMSISYSIWFPRYPLYEIAYQSWNLENAIYSGLGEPTKVKQKVERRLKATVQIHLAITWIGCFCFVISYSSFPKYYTFTYAWLEIESTFLCIVFGLHEFIFMLHAWNLMTGSNSLFTFQAVALSNIIEEMTSGLLQLCQNEENCREKSCAEKRATVNHNYNYGTVDEVIWDYKKLMMISEEYNKFISYKTVFLHICGYCQFISDVFLAVQILRIPGFGILDIWFYIEDSLASMYMIYRVYEFMSRVEPASREFFKALKYYLRFPRKNGERKHLQKVFKTLRLVSMKIGPCTVKRGTVLSAMDILSNYYICVALW